MFTKQHYVTIAQALKEMRDERNTKHDAIVNSVCYKIAAVFKQDNPRFDSARFLRACGCPNV